MSATTTHREALLEGAIARSLFSLSAPMLLVLILMASVGLVDMFFLGRFGTTALAAIGLALPIVGVVNALCSGISSAAVSVVSRAVGAGDLEYVKRLATYASLSTLALAVAITTAGLSSQGLLLRLAGASGDVLAGAQQYTSIWYAGSGFLVSAMMTMGILRGTGDVRSNAVIVLVIALGNLMLAPLLIFGLGPIPKQGIAGAAWATVIAEAGAAIFALVMAWRRGLFVRKGLNAREALDACKALGETALPLAISNLLGPATMTVLTLQIAAHGPAAVAALGAGSQIDRALVSVPLALCGGLQPLVGQNWAAGKIARVQQGAALGSRVAAVWGVAVPFALALAGEQVARLFTHDVAVIEALCVYLWVGPVRLGFAGATAIAMVSLQAIGRPRFVPMLNAVAMVLAVACAALTAPWLGYASVFAGLACANIATALLGGHLLRRALSSEPAAAYLRTSP